MPRMKLSFVRDFVLFYFGLVLFGFLFFSLSMLTKLQLNTDMNQAWQHGIQSVPHFVDLNSAKRLISQSLRSDTAACNLWLIDFFKVVSVVRDKSQPFIHVICNVQLILFDNHSQKSIKSMFWSDWAPQFRIPI